MLRTEDLTIRFGGHVAVNGVSCAFEPGTLTAIVGPNGAGKTTYFNLISGQLKATAGRVLLGGRELTGLAPSARTRAGLGRAFQLTDRKSTRLNSSHLVISYAVFCLKKKNR